MSALTPDHVLAGYRSGIFPMADPHFGNIVLWFDPDPRAILPLDTFHMTKSLARLVRRGVFEVTRNRDFEGVIRACADREETWISEEILQAYVALHRLGYAHSVECWREERLAGGLYGVALGGAFFGESMFHRERDASKVALVHLVDTLRRGGFVLLDTQYLTPHLARFGALEIPRAEYRRRLAAALRIEARWPA
ncbi:MAG: leucyl/phenylalanyl-tRNA--protein transferase [Bacteroidetes bacterium]|nr:MAG: leucyl/phenylalanyl-tRNA--protein transferase [Bacteroidota bacterium]